ncbi:hypothetical protein N7468_007905 [Penicillium chermesinum]|uniref:Wax synthase domain-containing protein n=1 Tax=Penicillium chermesinum TaxID=63820 RepID=A0A9W9NP57_9EURO|nr:uncharacterized protein N7468_007905 [Penicillium chermesinum]KAJ5223363.1 hypothetical protein N7468_007905 [Penicillium chermesinum]
MDAPYNVAEETSWWPLDAAAVIKLLVALCGPPFVFTVTSKYSTIRYAAAPFMMWLHWDIFSHHYPSKTDALEFSMATTPFNWLRLLIITPVDMNDLAIMFKAPAETLLQKLYILYKVTSTPRWINTPWETKNTPPFPKYYTRRHMKLPSRGSFLLRQSCILFWQLLILNLAECAGNLQASQVENLGEPKKFSWNHSTEKWIELIISNVIAWLLCARCLIDSHYRALSVLHVGILGDDVADWPPLFGTMLDSYTLRNFWGKFWHQSLRSSFTAVSNRFCRELLRLPRPSVLERYTNVFIVFLLSGTLHLALDYGSGLPTEVSGALFFFTAFTFGYMVEDGVQALWKRMFPLHESTHGNKETGTPRWQKIVGAIWVMLWLGVTSGPYLAPTMDLPPAILGPIPANIEVGFGPLIGFILVVGALIAYVFEGEP